RLAILEQLGRAGDVPGVQLGRPRARIVHHAEVNERVDIAGAKHVARLLAAQVDLVVLDVLGPADHRAAIEPDDLPAELVVQAAGDDLAEPAADAGDDDLARLTRRHARARAGQI